MKWTFPAHYRSNLQRNSRAIPSREGRFFPYRQHPNKIWSPSTPLSARWGAFNPETQRQEHKANHSFLSTAQVKNKWSYNSTSPYACMMYTVTTLSLNFNFVCLIASTTLVLVYFLCTRYTEFQHSQIRPNLV